MAFQKTGIDIVGDVPWGTHICQFYSSSDELEILGPFIKEGLLNNELCAWIYSQKSTYQQVKEIIKRHVGSVEDFINSGQLKITPYNKWYVKQNEFDENRVIQQLRGLKKCALENGFDGMRVVGDIGWLNENYTENFLRYEQNVNNLVIDFPAIFVCLYDIKTIGVHDFIRILQSHKYSVVNGKPGLGLRSVQLMINDKNSEQCQKKDEKLPLFLPITDESMKVEAFTNISHELRTPINVILLILQLLEFRGEDKKEKKYYRIMRQNCYRLLRLVNNLIDINRIDFDYFELNMQNCNIVEIVEEITLSVSDYVESKGLNLKFDTDIEEKIMACDPEQIERVILNLISNAIKFTPAGGNISVRLTDLVDKVVITVKDDGIGIPKSKLDCIFNKFQQVDRLFTRKHEGSGLGLPLVKSLVEKHGGKIFVKSEIGEGSEFIIVLPCIKLVEPKPVSKVEYLSAHDFVERANIELADISV